MHREDALFIGGTWVSPSTDEVIEVISPHSEEPVARVAAAGPADVDAAVAAARAAFDKGPWPRSTVAERIDVVRRLAKLFGERKSEMAQDDQHRDRRADHLRPACPGGPAADDDDRVLRPGGRLPVGGDASGFFGSDIHIRREPVGVVAAIVPWNMPQFLIVTKLMPALLAGCCVVLKPAPESPLDALLLADMLERARPAAGRRQRAARRRDGRRATRHPPRRRQGVVHGLHRGGSSRRRRVRRRAQAVSLELGGKSAAILLDDADAAKAAAGVRSASLSNSGQICNALTRILVPANRSADFVDALAAELTAMVIGDPADAATQVGPWWRSANNSGYATTFARASGRARDWSSAAPNRRKALTADGTSGPRCSATPTTR